jgi:hypothetical protein
MRYLTLDELITKLQREDMCSGCGRPWSEHSDLTAEEAFNPDLEGAAL